jgi:hypothetical protein
MKTERQRDRETVRQINREKKGKEQIFKRIGELERGQGGGR